MRRKKVTDPIEIETVKSAFDREVDCVNTLELEGKMQELTERSGEVGFDNSGWRFVHTATGRFYEITNRGWEPYERCLKFQRRKMPANPRLVRII